MKLTLFLSVTLNKILAPSSERVSLMDRQAITALVDELYDRTMEACELIDRSPVPSEEIEQIESAISGLWSRLAEVVSDREAVTEE